MFKRFNWFIKEYKFSYLLAFILMFANTACDIIAPRLIGRTADLIARGNLKLPGLYRNVGIILLSIVLAYGLTYAYQYLIFRGTDLMGREARRKLLRKLLVQGPVFYEKNTTGSLMGKATNDVRNLQDMAGFGMMSLVMSTVYPLVIMAVMAYTISLKMVVLAVGPMVLIIIFTRIMGPRLYRLFDVIQRAFDRLNDAVLENVNGVRVIRAFNREESEKYRFSQRSKDYYRANMDQVKISAMFPGVTKVVPGISYLIAFAYGVYLMSKSQMSLGSLISFTMYLGLLIRPVFIFGEFITVFQMASASMDRIWELWNYKEDVVDKKESIVYKGGTSIVFDDFSFNYSDGSQALNGINISLEPGQTLGVVGKIGSGKTTFLKQLLRYYPIKDKSILLGDRPIEDYKISTIRDKIGYVPQEHILFSKSIRDNLTFGRDYSEDDIQRALDLSDFAKDIEKMPKGLETLVGERGVSLSGGQKQRLSIARALIKDPEILILDDSLSAVDAKTEKNIIRNLVESRAGKTTIISAHRLSGIMHAQEIIVLDEGRIIERGSHEELVALGGWYHDQFEIQKLEEDDE